MLIAAGPLNVATPGTKVAVSSLALLNEAGVPIQKCHGIAFQAKPLNSGTVTIYQRQADGSYTQVWVLGIPTTTILPSFSMALTWSANAVGLTDLYLDAENATNGALVSVLIG